MLPRRPHGMVQRTATAAALAPALPNAGRSRRGCRPGLTGVRDCQGASLAGAVERAGAPGENIKF